MSVSIVFIQNQSNKIETICSIPGQSANSVCKQGVGFNFSYLRALGRLRLIAALGSEVTSKNVQWGARNFARQFVRH
jgi:hypothetical protein